jgi:magnesium transporter
MIVDNAVYLEGKRILEPGTIEAAYDASREVGGVVWIGLKKPDPTEFGQMAREFKIHELAIEDSVVAHQRPKIERYDDILFVVLKSARYVDRREEVEFSEIHVYVGKDFVVTVRHGEGSELTRVRRRMESDPELLTLGPEAILYAIMDRVVDDYAPVVRGLENDIDEIETEMFSGDMDITRRTYELSREVIEFQRATKPLVAMVSQLIAGAPKYGTPDELVEYLRDVQDHAIQVQEQVGGMRELLQNILNTNIAVVTLQQNVETKAMTEASLAQNDEVKKISSWAAILFTPTLIGTIYGMNFVHMPELDWRFGYPMAMGLMLIVGFVMWAWFRRNGWLK